MVSSEENAGGEAPALVLGSVALFLKAGDALTEPADAVCCPTDDLCSTREGLLGVLRRDRHVSEPLLPPGKRLIQGEALMVPATGLAVPRVILISIINLQYGSVSRETVQRGLSKALQLADAQGLGAVACPILGHPKSRVNQDIISGYMIRAVQTFAQGNPKSVNRVNFFAYNSGAHSLFQQQMFAYQHALQ